MAEAQATGGIGFLGLLTILFIGLKLTNYVAWSWLWVLAPLWIPLAFWLSFLVLVFSIGLGALAIAFCLDQK